MLLPQYSKHKNSLFKNKTQITRIRSIMIMCSMYCNRKPKVKHVNASYTKRGIWTKSFGYGGQSLVYSQSPIPPHSPHLKNRPTLYQLLMGIS